MATVSSPHNWRAVAALRVATDHLFWKVHLKPAVIDRIYAEGAYGAAQSRESVLNNIRCTETVVKEKIPGALVECGVYMGSTQVLFIRTLQALDRGLRDIWLYDSFDGMPKPEVWEEFKDGVNAVEEWMRLQGREGAGSEWVRCDYSTVMGRLDKLGYRGRIRAIIGWVEETIPAFVPLQIAILRLDTDWYASTKHELTHLYPLVSPGGFVIIDDYGAFNGSRKATDEFLGTIGMSPSDLRVIDEHVRMWRKPASIAAALAESSPATTASNSFGASRLRRERV